MNREYITMLAEEVAERFIETHAENYIGDSFTITRDSGESFEVVVTCHKPGSKSLAELYDDARDKIESLERQLGKYENEAMS
jgi:hypothetical protein